MKNTVTILVALLVLGLIIWAIAKGPNRDDPAVVGPDQVSQVTEPVQLCYYRNSPTATGLSDVSWVRMSLAGGRVSGEVQYLPAERDSKTGPISGTVSPMNPTTSSRTATVIWTASAEGITNPEELVIEFGEGAAALGFGEMVDNGNGTYVYAHKDAITYAPAMSQVDCEVLGERVSVEQYIRKNIATISPDSAVLGGTWYVTSVSVDDTANTGTVSYEDGHIAKRATFSYSYNNAANSVTINNISTVAQ